MGKKKETLLDGGLLLFTGADQVVNGECWILSLQI